MSTPRIASPAHISSPSGDTGASHSEPEPTHLGLRAAVALGRVEATLLTRNALVLAGLVGAALVGWYFITKGEPLWWNAGWQIGYGQMILSAIVLAATQLAAGRARRNNMENLYNSFPVSARTRAAGHLVSLVGVLPASVILIAAAGALLEWRDVIGSPDPAALAAGVLLVIAGAAIGVALGLRFPHPFVGALAALVWIVPFGQSNGFNGAVIWLFPWVEPRQLGQFPHPVTGYPPAAAHAVELAGVAALAGVATLAWGSRATIRRGVLLAAGAAAVALTCIAGVVELQPIATTGINSLVSEAANPVSVQTCTTDNDVRYCLYPGFASLRSSLQAPVNAVLANVPVRPAQALTIEQATILSLDDPTLTHGHSEAQIAAWAAELNNASPNTASPSTIYLDVGSWPATGGAAATARFNIALGAAEWSVGLPPHIGTYYSGSQCVPVNQAREAIAIWLAIETTHTSPAWVHSEDAGLLAEAMTGLPTAKVALVLDPNWATWTDWHSTDAQLAAALGIPNPTPRRGQVTSNAPDGTPPPSQNVCK